MSRSLPPNASVDFLKKEAKQLLRAYRAGDVSAVDMLRTAGREFASKGGAARLSDFQSALARSYGFASWEALVVGLKSGGAEHISKTLIFTNGRCACDVLGAAGVPGQKVEWLDVLHDGELAAGLDLDAFSVRRAEVIERFGWAEAREVLRRLRQRNRLLDLSDNYSALQLWFEHDLFDQLQLVQILAELRERPGWFTKAFIVQTDDFIGGYDADEIREQAAGQRRVETDDLKLAVEAWAALRSPDPRALGGLVAAGTPHLRHLGAGVRRFCQEHPAPLSGLSRTEFQILDTLSKASEPLSPGALFAASQAREKRVFMGDASFFVIVKRLSVGSRPLLRLAGKAEGFAQAFEVGWEACDSQRIQITDQGMRCLAGQVDFLDEEASRRWIGGVCIKGRDAWRWSEAEGVFVRP